MPLTPLHLAAGLPARRHISLKAFILVNLLIDIEPGIIMFFNMDYQGYAIHGWVHTLGGVSMIALTLLIFGLPFAKPRTSWLYGTLLGAYSHLLLDALVHSDVQPFAPFWSGNPLYRDAHMEISILCAVVLTHYLAQWVQSLRVGEKWASLLIRIRRKFFPGSLGE